MHKPSHCRWVSPLTAISFSIVAITGVLMLFHTRIPGMRGLHEWMGVVMVAAGLVHLLLNWKPLVSYFRHRAAVTATVVCLLLGVAIVVIAAIHDSGHREGQKRFRGPATEMGGRFEKGIGPKDAQAAGTRESADL